MSSYSLLGGQSVSLCHSLWNNLPLQFCMNWIETWYTQSTSSVDVKDILNVLPILESAELYALGHVYNDRYLVTLSDSSS